MSSVIFYGAILAVVYFYFYREAVRHKENIAKLTLRIHVNGTRGKSSVTRLIAAGLRAGGHKVVAKTTGTEAKLIFPDGSEQYLVRRGPANIRENIKVISQAASLGADAVVIECMAIQPELQKFCEQRLIKSTIGVITNVRLDHEDVMGKGLENVATALSNTCPQHGILVTTSQDYALLAPVLDKQQPVVTATYEPLDEEYLRGFPYEVVPENIAIALKVCELAGVAPQIAASGMRHAIPDAGNLTIRKLMIENKHITVINAMAANDPDSTLWLWQHYLPKSEVAVLLNCRADRKLRTTQLCEVLVKVHKGIFIVAGDLVFARSILLKKGVPPQNIHTLADTSDFSCLETLFRDWPCEQLCVFAAGNVKGLSSQFMMKLNGGI